MIRSHTRRVTRRLGLIVASKRFLGTAIGLLAFSAVLGNFAQVVDRENLQNQLTDAKAETAAVSAELDQTKGEQECRSQAASDSELFAGRIQVALSDLVVASRTRDDEAAERAVEALRVNAPLLLEALDARQQSVQTCSEERP